MLNDIRIIDLSRLLPGPYASWLLGSMGAHVTKIEQPGRGDYIRQDWPRREGSSLVFHLYNQGKRSVALNLKEPEGRRALLDLVAGADVLIDGNRPGVMDRLQVGWEACRARNPRLVFCAITGFGQTGPYAQRVGHDINYLSLAGVLSGLKATDGRPITPRVTFADMAGGGLMAAIGILGALFASRESGQGRFVDISMTDSALSMQGLRLGEELLDGERPAQDGDSSTQDGQPGDDDWELGTYLTSDGRWISLDPYEARFKQTLWEIVSTEVPGCGAPDRGLGREHVRAKLTEALAQRPRARWDELLGAAEVCYAPVYELDELEHDVNVQARGLLGDALDPEVRSPGIASPLRFDPPAQAAQGGAPRIGQHTEEALLEAGWDREAIQRAATAGAIELG